MTALLINDDLYPVLSLRTGETVRETGRLVVSDCGLEASTVDNASQLIVLEHFRLGTWIGQSLTTIRHLEAGWDGYGAPKIGWEVIRRMSRALSCLQPAQQFGAGAIVPAADGSLQAEWHLETVSIELCIDADLSENLWIKDRTTGLVTEHDGPAAIRAFEAAIEALRL